MEVNLIGHDCFYDPYKVNLNEEIIAHELLNFAGETWSLKITSLVNGELGFFDASEVCWNRTGMLL